MPFPYLADRRSLTDAEALIASFGAGAAREATLRAGRSRELGNHLHFCRWRQIARLIPHLTDATPPTRLH